MRKFLLFIFFVATVQGFSQTMSISGSVQDTVAKMPLKNAVAMAIRIKDSVLLAHARTDAKGGFTLNLAIDTVQVVVSHSQFSDQSYYLFGSITNNVFDFGKIILPPKSQQLKEVVIYAYKDPVYYKGDTLIYTADSFKVKPNATVEDLLKKLPGIRVDAQGKITSQGKEVSQVLVDGDEFFGTDPTMATKNLAASGVESVQVYEKKNENASSSDETIQVMDLKLKEDAKKGYFGKVSGASDFQKYYEGELLANKFKGSQKISVFTLASNTPRSSFGWNESYKYGLSNEMNFQTDEDGNPMYWSGMNNQNQGIPQTLKSGIYYTDKLSKNTKLNFNYSYSDNQLKVSEIQKSQYFLVDTAYSTDNSNEGVQKFQTHSINAKWMQTIDSLTDLELEHKLKLNTIAQENEQLTRFLTLDDSLTRQTFVDNSNKSLGYDLNTTARVNRRFRKQDRLLKLSYNLFVADNSATGFLNSIDHTIAKDSIIDQKKTNNTNSQTHNATVVYTEPLTPKIKFELEYVYNFNLNQQDKKAQNYLNGEYTVIDSLLTNRLNSKRVVNRLGVKFIRETKKQSINIGARLRNVSINNENLITQKPINQTIDNILPFFSYFYRFSQTQQFNIRYTTSSMQPSVNQLQPVPDNTNPNSVIIGNTNLLPTFNHNVSVNFNTYKPLSGRYVWAGGNWNTTNDAFSNSIVYDVAGKATSQAVNVDGTYNMNAYVGAGIPLFQKTLTVQPSLDASYSSYTNYINNQENNTINKGINTRLGLDFNWDTLSFNISYGYDYNSPSSTLNATSNKPYTQHQINATVNLKLPLKFFVETDALYIKNSQRAQGYNINYCVWNATVSKAFLKNENLICSLIANDILNQNVNINRAPSNNVITDTKTKIISRYFLFKLTYKFNSTKTKESDDYF